MIPARVRLGVDVRAIEGTSLHRLERAIRADVAAIAARREIDADVRRIRAGEPVAIDPRLATIALDVACRHGVAVRETWSGAGHDAQHLAALVPTLLLFVPLRGGESHTPFEDADTINIERAAAVAREVLVSAS